MYPRSNLVHRLCDEWPRSNLPNRYLWFRSTSLLTDRTVWESSSLPSSGGTGRWGGDAIANGSAGSTSPYRPQLMNCRLLRDLDVERNSFCLLIVAETDGGKLATQRRLGWSSMAVGASSGGAPALESAPAAAEQLGQPPSGLGSARQASSWHGVGGSVW
jgi:hypothetical protein